MATLRCTCRITLTAKETESKTGTKRFYGGLLDNRAGTINPMGYVRGLARIALAAGARISTGIHVEKLARENGLWQVQFGEQILRAKTLILATNAYTDNLWPGLKQTFTKINFFLTKRYSRPSRHRIDGFDSKGHGKDV